MKCPTCQAKLLPVAGEMFCLQCGNAVSSGAGVAEAGPEIEDTTDPLLQKAIIDAVRRPVHFRLPVSGAPLAKATKSFSSIGSVRSVLAPPRPVASAGPVAALPALPAPKAAAASSLNLFPAKPQRQRVRFRLHAPPLPWIVGLVVFGLFLAVNAGLSAYYSSRVYPGVRVGAVALGGLPLGAVRARLAAESQPELTAMAGTAKYALDTHELSTADLDQAVRQAQLEGHSTPLPVAGALETLFSKPVVVRRQLNPAVVNGLTANLAKGVDRAASDAAPLIVGGQAFVIAEKDGTQLDAAKTAAGIRAAYGNKNAFNVSTNKLVPLVTASAYDADLASAQAVLGVSLQLKLGSATYRPTAQQLGSWVVFSGPGKGVAVDGSQVAAYVASIPGRFDRAAATAALLAAVQARQSLTYTASVRKITAAPKLPAAVAAPPKTYTYCVKADTAAESNVLASRAAAALADASGWSLGGKLKFVQVAAGCNFSLNLMPASAMGNVSPGCAGKTTCGVAGTVALNLADWLAPPASWAAGADAYRGEMIGHEVGQWLGFEHASCTAKPGAAAPILEAPTVVLNGCSPDWYEIPAGSQGSKALPGF